MKLDDALEHIDAIYGHLNRTEVYRGYRPLPVAGTGVLAILGSCLQPWALPAPDAPDASVAYVIWWVAISLLAIGLVASQVVQECLSRKSAAFRRTTRQAIFQFLPCLAAGAVLTALLSVRWPHLVALLPGLWALVFSLGIFSSRPHLPRAIGWVGLFYFTAGGLLLGLAESGASLSAWSMGAVFGTGQLLAALVLYRNLERSPRHGD
jgi:hypothetical protein